MVRPPTQAQPRASSSKPVGPGSRFTSPHRLVLPGLSGQRPALVCSPQVSASMTLLVVSGQQVSMPAVDPRGGFPVAVGGVGWTARNRTAVNTSAGGGGRSCPREPAPGAAQFGPSWHRLGHGGAVDRTKPARTEVDPARVVERVPWRTPGPSASTTGGLGRRVVSPWPPARGKPLVGAHRGGDSRPAGSWRTFIGTRRRGSTGRRGEVGIQQLRRAKLLVAHHKRVAVRGRWDPAFVTRPVEPSKFDADRLNICPPSTGLAGPSDPDQETDLGLHCWHGTSSAASARSP